MGEYIVSARKYRPVTFDDVVGQQHVTSTLKTALQKGQLAQAYLFTGPRGVGKTTCARILAKVVNCENPVDGNTACDQCDSCKAFNENISFNIFELDAASNNSVENIRSLIDEQVRYMPQKGKYKVFIIDEVHMLSKSAFNAFLKTLEEPPAHAIFILATTEKHKIIPTILSRCQIYDFKTIQIPDIVKQLERISVKEGVKYEKEALNIIANKADGAMRDALSIYDRIVSSANDDFISYKQVLENLNMLDYDYYFRVTEYILQKDISAVFLLLDEIIKQGFDINLFILGLAEHIRQLLVSKDTRTHVLLNTGEELKQRYLDQSQLIDKSFALTALNILNHCDYTYSTARNKRLHVEIALSKLCHINDIMDFDFSQIEKKKIKPDNKVSQDPEQKTEKKTVTVDTSIESEGKEVKKVIEDNTDRKPEVDKPVEINQESKDVHISSDEQKRKDDTLEISKTERKENTGNADPVITKKSTGFGFPKLDELLEEIKNEEKNQKDPIPIDFDKIKDVVFELINEHTSKLVINVLKELDFEESGDSLIIFVPTQLAKDTLIEEKELISRIRKVHYNPALEVIIEVDIKKFPDHHEIKTKKVLTTKEKYELLINKNPLISDFIKKFDLHIDS